MWHELPLAQAHLERIEFKTYDALLPEAPKALKGEADFHQWYARYINHQKTITRTKHEEIIELDAPTVYQELRIASAYSKETYLSLRKRQSSLPLEQQPLALYAL